MSAGVLLRYAGGSVYALPRHVVGLVWDLAVARRIHGDNASSEEFEAWYRAVRIVDLSRVGKVTR